MKILSIVLALLCNSAFATDFVDGMVKGEKFTLDLAVHPIPICKPGKDAKGVEWTCTGPVCVGPVTVFPVKKEFSAVLQGAPGYASPRRCEIRIVQFITTEQMLETLAHELGHLAGGQHADQMSPVAVVTEEVARARAMENARACAFRQPNCR